MAQKSPDQPCERASQATGFLPRQEAFLRQILDINPNLIFAKDRQGKFTLANQALADIYGTTIGELVGKTDADFNSDPEQVAFFRSIDLKVMDSKKELFIPEEVITDASGKRHWLQTVKRPIIGPDGVANQVLGVATDITHRRELEEQLRQAQKMEAIGQLAGGIAHDFNNMLAVILGNAERLLIKYRNAGTSDKTLVVGLELIQSAGSRAAELVNQLLTFSRRQPLAPVVVNLGEVVASLTELLKTLIGERVRVIIRRNDGEARVRVDRGRIEQLLVNLVVNARDAMPSGGDVVVETGFVSQPQECDLPGLSQGPCVSLTVTDSGVGIPPDVIDRIFEPFFSTKAARGKGTGLGLSIVYGIVQQAGGNISVRSTPGKGTTFRVLLPTVADPLTPAAAANPAEVGEGNETILVCEDEPGVLRLISDNLQEQGYRVLTAANGPEALRIAKNHEGEIHVLLTDLVMPKMTGRELAQMLHSMRPDLRILFMTGYPSNVLGPLANGSVRHKVLNKPFQTSALLKAIRSLLAEPVHGGSHA